MFKIPNRHWRVPIGFSRAEPTSIVGRGFQEQYCYRDKYKQNLWMQRTLEDCQNNLKGKVQTPIFVQMWNPETKGTIGNDMPQETTHNVFELLRDPLGQEWQQAKEAIEHKNGEDWHKTCGVGGRKDLPPTLSLKDKAA